MNQEVSCAASRDACHQIESDFSTVSEMESIYHIPIGRAGRTLCDADFLSHAKRCIVDFIPN